MISIYLLLDSLPFLVFPALGRLDNPLRVISETLARLPGSLF